MPSRRKFFAGCTFWVAPDSHLWIVVSDPQIDPAEILYVNLTTFHDDAPKHDAENDRACIVEPGEHGFVTHRSCVYFYGAHVSSIQQLEARLREGQIKLHTEPASLALLTKIRESAGESIHMIPDHYDVLCRQKLV